MRRTTLLAEKRLLVVPEHSMVTQQGMILDNFSDFLVGAMKEELTQIVYLMLNRVDIDFDLGRIYKIEVHPEFIELFRMGLMGGEWKESESGEFYVDYMQEKLYKSIVSLNLTDYGSRSLQNV